MATEETARIVVDSRETFTKMLEFAREYTTALRDRIEHHAGERPVFDLNRLEDRIETAPARPVRTTSAMGSAYFDMPLSRHPPPIPCVAAASHGACGPPAAARTSVRRRSSP